MLQGGAESKETIHGEFDIDVHLTSLVSDQRHTFKVFWRQELEYTRFHTPFTAELSFAFEETALQYKIQVGGFHGHLVWSPHVYTCPEVVERGTPAVLTVFSHSYSDSNDPADLELTAQVCKTFSSTQTPALTATFTRIACVYLFALLCLML